jgi:hypothetical protein
LLRDRIQPVPVVACKARGAVWVSPDLFCRIGYLEEIESGESRASSFDEQDCFESPGGLH